MMALRREGGLPRLELLLLPLLLTLAMAGCDAGFFAEDTGSERGSLELRLAAGAPGPASTASPPLLGQTAGAPAVFQAVTAVRVQLAGGGRVLIDETVPADRTNGEIRLRFEFELEEDSLESELELDLLVDGAPVFSGGGSVTLQQGQTASTEVPLETVAGDIQLGPDPAPLDALGDTVRLEGSVTFATGDPVPDASLAWESLDPDVVQVSSDGLATSVSAGEGRARATFQEFTRTLTVRVEPVVVDVQVTPTGAQIDPGESVALNARPLDRLGNELEAPIAWSSSAADTATVSSTGIVTGRRPGPVSILATSGEVQTNTDVQVRAIAPSLAPINPLGVTPSEARIRTSINPRGLPSQVNFRWGTNPTLSESETTPVSSTSDGISFISFGHNLSGLNENTTYYYQAVASNDAGTSEGNIRSFSTGAVPTAPPTPSVTWRAGEVVVEWEYEAFNGSFEVESGMVADFEPHSEWAFVGSTSARRFTNSPEPRGETWAYRVRACRLADCSEPSAPDSTLVPRDVLYGFVFDEAGQPAPGVSVAVSQVDVEGTETAVAVSVTTDNSGYYHIIADMRPGFDFLPGLWRVEALQSGEAVGFVATEEFEVASSAPFMQRVDLNLEEQEVSDVTVSPESGEVDPGEQLFLSAIVLDPLGNVLSGMPVAWSSASPTTAIVNNSGVVTGRRPGTTTITASSGGATGEAQILVPAIAPTLEALDPEDVSVSGAIIRTSVNPRGLQTDVQFRWGTLASLADGELTSPQTLDDGISNLEATAELTGLADNTTYYYRAVASNDAGTTEGEIRSFTTVALPEAPPTPFVDWRAGEVTLGWEYNVGFDGTFQVESGMVADNAPPSEWTVIGSTSDLSFSNAPEPRGETWAYRVRACQGELCSDPSMPDSAYVPQDVVYGFVTNQGGEPVPFASIFMTSSGGENTVFTSSDASGYFEIIAEFQAEFAFTPTGPWFYDASASDGFADGEFEVTASPFMLQIDMVLDPSPPG